MGGLDRAAAILDAFDADHRELTLAALVRRCGLPRSTTHRTADRMLRLGWLDKPDAHYRIGNRVFELSGLVPIRHELREAVLPFLQDLYAATHTTVQLGVLQGTQVLVVEKITGHRPMPMPLHAHEPSGPPGGVHPSKIQDPCTASPASSTD